MAELISEVFCYLIYENYYVALLSGICNVK